MCVLSVIGAVQDKAFLMGSVTSSWLLLDEVAVGGRCVCLSVSLCGTCPALLESAVKAVLGKNQLSKLCQDGRDGPPSAARFSKLVRHLHVKG